MDQVQTIRQMCSVWLWERGVRLFGIWCRTDGGPSTTIVHVFGYPYEKMRNLLVTSFTLMVLSNLFIAKSTFRALTCALVHVWLI